MARTCMQPRLGRGPVVADQCMHDRSAECARDAFSLVEAADDAPPGIQRHWHDDIDLGEVYMRMVDETRRQTGAQRLMAGILEGVDDGPHRPRIAPGARDG